MVRYNSLLAGTINAVSTIEHLVKSWVNPFEEARERISISTSPEDISSDLKNARYIGVECYTNFKAVRLETGDLKLREHCLVASL